MATKPLGIDWGRVPPEKRGRWGRWLRTKRGTNGQKVVLAMLETMGRPIGGSYYSEMETGEKSVNEDWRGVFTRAYGESADDWDDPWEEADAPSSGHDLHPASVEAIKALTAAAEAQAAAMREIAEEMRLARAAAQAREEGLAVALGDLAGTLERLRLAPAVRSGE